MTRHRRDQARIDTTTDIGANLDVAAHVHIDRMLQLLSHLFDEILFGMIPVEIVLHFPVLPLFQFQVAPNIAAVCRFELAHTSK